MTKINATAVVTGAAGDIGREIVSRLINEGYHVEGWDLSAEGLKENDQAWANAGYTSRVVNIMKMSEIEAAANSERDNPVKVLVNNAGGASESGSLKETTEDNFVRDLDLNLTSSWRCMEQLLDQLKGDGTIINIVSVNGLGVFGHPGYSAAKAGLINLTHFAAVEFGKEGIRCNAIAPGSVRTKAWSKRVENDPKILERLERWYPLKKVCDPSDIAAAVAFLVSKDARMITGAILPVDGGLSVGVDTLAGEIAQADI